jgi:hypothetical protein
VTRVELFEIIRREHFVHGRSIRDIAREHHVHRRVVRQALASAIPPQRKRAIRVAPVLTEAFRHIIDGILDDDRQAPRKQRHTARRICKRLIRECTHPQWVP